jgi:PST family polysaccharide transporter
MKNKTLESLIWVICGSGAQILIKLLVIVILARLLTPSDFGIVSLVLLVLAIGQIISKFGLGHSIIWKFNVDIENIAIANGISIFFGVCVCLFFYFSSPYIASFFEQPDIENLIKYVGVVPVLLGISQIREAIIQKNMQFRQLTIIDGISNLIGYGLISIILAINNFGAASIIFGIIFQEFMRTIFICCYVKLDMHFSFSLIKAYDLIKYGFGISAVQTTNAVSYQLDNLVVGKFLSIEALGLYSRAYQVVTVSTKVFGNSLLKVLFPVMSEIKNNSYLLKQNYEKLFFSAFLIAVPISIFLYSTSKDVIALMLGEQWLDAVIPFQILSLMIFLRIPTKISDSLIRASGSIKILLSIQLFYAFSIFTFSYFGRIYGISGVAVGVFFATLINFLLMTLYVTYILQTTFFKFLNKIFIILLIFAFTTFLPLFFFSLLLKSYTINAFLALTINAIITFILYVLTLRYLGVHMGSEADRLKKILFRIG